MKPISGNYCRAVVLAACTGIVINVTAGEFEGGFSSAQGVKAADAETAVCERAYRNPFLRARNIGYRTGDCGSKSGPEAESGSLAADSDVEAKTGEENECEPVHLNAYKNTREGSRRKCAG